MVSDRLKRTLPIFRVDFRMGFSDGFLCKRIPCLFQRFLYLAIRPPCLQCVLFSSKTFQYCFNFSSFTHLSCGTCLYWKVMFYQRRQQPLMQYISIYVIWTLFVLWWGSPFLETVIPFRLANIIISDLAYHKPWDVTRSGLMNWDKYSSTNKSPYNDSSLYLGENFIHIKLFTSTLR